MWKNVLVAAVLPTTFELGLFVIGCEPAPSCPTTHVVLVWFLHILAEAACKHIVELAKAEAAANPYCSEDMLKFARIRLCDAERGVHSVLKQVGLIAPVPVTELNLGPGKLANFPCIKLSDWMLHLLNTKRFARQMAGVADFGLMQSVLTEFWRRYEAINSGHAVFEMARNGTLRLDRCVPFFSHSDEGRSYKHMPLWILSAHGALGRGTRSWLQSGKHRAPVRRNGMGMNFIGKTWSTQFMFASMLRTLSTQHPEAMTKLLEAFAEDVFDLMSHGVTSDDGDKVWMIHMATKGDLPALVKLGGFCRSFSHVPRAPRSRRFCQGICHLCLAGREAEGGNIPFEDFSPSADWIDTMFRELPWETEPIILQNLPYNQQDKIEFFRTDFWHNLHLGVSKHWIGSCFVAIIESDLPDVIAGSVEVKFQWLTGAYLAYWRSKGKTPFVTEISRETMGFPQGSTCPIARWSKAVASTELMLFLEWFADNHIVGKTTDALLLSIVPFLLITSNYVFLVFAASKKNCVVPFWQEWLLFVFSFMMLRQEVSRPSTSQWVLCTIAVSGWKNNMVLHLGNWSLVSWHILPFVPTRLYSKGSAALQSPLRCTCWPTLGTTSCKRLRFRSGVETLSPTPIKSKKTLLAGQAGSAEGWTSVHSIDLCWCGHWFFINVLCFSQIMTHVVLMGMAIGENVV